MSSYENRKESMAGKKVYDVAVAVVVVQMKIF